MLAKSAKPAGLASQAATMVHTFKRKHHRFKSTDSPTVDACDYFREVSLTVKTVLEGFKSVDSFTFDAYAYS